MSIPQDKEMAYDKLHYSLKLPQLDTLDKKNSNPIEIFKKWHWPSLTVPYSPIKLWTICFWIKGTQCFFPEPDKKIIPRNMAQRKSETQFMESQLAGLQDPSCGVTYLCFIFEFYFHWKKNLRWECLPVSSQWPSPGIPPFCPLGKALTGSGQSLSHHYCLYVKLIYQSSNVQNLGGMEPVHFKARRSNVGWWISAWDETL